MCRRIRRYFILTQLMDCNFLLSESIDGEESTMKIKVFNKLAYADGRMYKTSTFALLMGKINWSTRIGITVRLLAHIPLDVGIRGCKNDVDFGSFVKT